MKQKKKMSLLAKQSAAGWVFLTPGYDPGCHHGLLADDPGVHYVTADRIQCKHALERADF